MTAMTTPTDDQIKGVLQCVENFIDTCPALDEVDVDVTLDDEVLHDGDYTRFAGTVTINGVEFTLVLERFAD